MTIWRLSLKRYLTAGRLVLLLAICLAVLGGGTAGHQAALRPCGILCQDESAAALEVQSQLVKRGFVPYDDLNTMTDDISMGVLDCGAVLLPGIGQGIAQGEYAGFVQLFVAPDSFLTEAYQAHLTAALYAAAAPALISQAADAAGVRLESDAIQRQWEQMLDTGYRFRIEVVTTQGKAPEAPDYPQAIAAAAGALLLFAAVVPGTVRLSQEADRLRHQIGGRKALTGVLLPGLTWQLLLCTLAAAPFLGKAGWAVPGYLMSLTALGLLLARSPLSLKPLLPLVLLGSLALMPIYFDLTGVYPQLWILRYLLPPCWLLVAQSHPVLCTGIGGFTTAVLLALYCVRRKP